MKTFLFHFLWVSAAAIGLIYTLCSFHRLGYESGYAKAEWKYMTSEQKMARFKEVLTAERFEQRQQAIREACGMPDKMMPKLEKYKD